MKKDTYPKNIAPKVNVGAADRIGQYVGQAKLFAPKYPAQQKAAAGPNTTGTTGLTGVT